MCRDDALCCGSVCPSRCDVWKWIQVFFFFKPFFFWDFGTNKAGGALKLLMLGVPHALQAPRGRRLHGLVSPTMSQLPLVGCAPGRSIQGKKRNASSPPVSSKLGMGGLKEVPRFRLLLAQPYYKTVENPHSTTFPPPPPSSAEHQEPAVGTSRNEGKTTCIYLSLKCWHILEGRE